MGDPLRQAEHGGRQQAPAVDHLAERFQVSGPLLGRGAGQPDAVTDYPAVGSPQRHPDPPARLDLTSQRVRHRIVELLHRTRGEHDRGHQLLGLVVGLPRLGLGLEKATLPVGHEKGRLGGKELGIGGFGIGD